MTEHVFWDKDAAVYLLMKVNIENIPGTNGFFYLKVRIFYFLMSILQLSLSNQSHYIFVEMHFIL